VTRMKMKAARLGWDCGVEGAAEDKDGSPREWEIVAGKLPW
jgi:hypothetical protein